MEQKVDLEKIIFDAFKSSGAQPKELIEALGHSLLTVMMAYCQLHEYSIDICEASMAFMDKIGKSLRDEIQEHHPDKDYVTIEELQERVKDVASKLKENEADKKSRANACKNIMDAETVGFLLLSYLEDGHIRMSSNLRDKKMTAEVLALLRETLFGKDAAKLVKLG